LKCAMSRRKPLKTLNSRGLRWCRKRPAGCSFGAAVVTYT
jgi:hypothetical protein